MQRSIIAALAALGFLAGVQGQNLLPNGSFEMPGLPNGETTRFLTNGSTFLPGWRVIDDGIGEPPLYAHLPRTEAVLEGGYGLILNQGSGVTATFRTEPGLFYELSFWSRPDDCRQCVSPAPLSVTISGASHLMPLISGWSKQSVQFYATNSVNTVQIFNPSSSGDFKKFGLDDVRVTEVGGAVLQARFYPGVIVEGVIGATYRIEAANSLNSIQWQTLTNLVLSNSPHLFIDADPKRPRDPIPRQRVYRATRVP